jgi:hypothetical protein
MDSFATRFFYGRSATYGFIELTQQLRETLLQQDASLSIEQEWTFGAAVMIAEGREEGVQQLSHIQRIAGHPFPVIHICGTLRRSGIPPHPNIPTNAGSSACWARVRASGEERSWKQGIVTAAHVASAYPLGTRVALLPSKSHAHPSSGRLVAVAECPIDAAILDASSDKLPNLPPLNIPNPAHNPIAQNTPAHLDGRHTQRGGLVLRVNQDPGYFGTMVAERIVFDFTGIPGDSGGLLYGATPQDGLGIYMGDIPTKPGGARLGVAQGLWQACDYFRMDVFA